MSSGRFVRSRYEADNGTIHPIRLQPETLEANIGGGANAAPSASTDTDLSAKVSRGGRAFGLRPRFVTVVWSGEAPSGYDDRTPLRIPILTESRFDAINVNSTGTYLGASVTVISKTPESIR